MGIELATHEAINGVELNQIRKEILSEINQRINSTTKLPALIGQIICMAQSALKASASSVLLLDEKKKELFFEVAEGQMGHKLKHIRMSTRSGIAGWVVCHGRPLIVNDVSKDSRFCHSVDKNTGFTTRSIMAVPLVADSKFVGVIEVINKNDGAGFSDADLEVITPVAAIAAIAIENTKLQQAVTDGYKMTIKALAASIDAKDPYTRGHSQRVTEYALIGAHFLRLPPDEIETIEYGGILHDTGKIGIPDRILKKPGPLSEEEWRIMVQHPIIGASILEDIPFLDKAREVVLHHHESYDGNGYPDKIASQQIPFGARLIAVADTFDTMTTSRPYRTALPKEDAIAELLKCSGTQFCPVAVGAFMSGLSLNNHSFSLEKVETGKGAP